MNKEESLGLFEAEDYTNKYNKVKSVLYGERLSDVKLSIMIPTYKRKDLLIKAIESAFFQKTKIRYEVVVIDNNNGTTEDEILCLLDRFEGKGLSYYKNESNIGMFGNWNRCITLANGEWVVILNDDDELEEDYVEKMLTTVSKYHDCVALACQNYFIDENDRILEQMESSILANKIIRIFPRDFFFFQPANIYGCLIKKQAALDMGGFDERYFPCSDAKLLIGLCNKKGLYLCSEKLLKYRWAVNESQKKDIQIAFAKFSISKAIEMNRYYGFYSYCLETFLLRIIIDFNLFNLKRNNIIFSIEEGIRLLELKSSPNGFYWINAQLYRVISKLYKLKMHYRKSI